MKKLISSVCLFIACTSLSLAQAQKSETLIVMLNGPVSVDHAPLIIAAQQGFFKQQHLTVKFVTPAAHNDAVKSLIKGESDLAITYEPHFIEQVDKGMPLIRVGTLIDKPLDCLAVLDNGKIKTFTDLKGKKIGISEDGVNNMVLHTMLSNQGLTSKDVKIIPIKNHLRQALLTHQVDAILGTMRNTDIPQMELSKHNVLAFFPEEQGVPNYSELIFVTRPANKNDARFPRFLTAIKEAVRYLDEHPQQTWAAFAKQYPQINNSLNHQAWLTTLPYFAEEPTDIDQQEWQRFAQLMAENHLINKVQPLLKYTIIV